MTIISETFLYTEILWMFVIVINNLSTIIIVLVNKNLRSTINNFLLSLFTGNLIYGLSTVFSIITWYSSDMLANCQYCCISHIVVTVIPALGILCSLTAMTIDRYISVFYPLKYPQIVTPKVVRAVLILIWSFSLGAGNLLFIWNEDAVKKKSRRRCSFMDIIPDDYTWIFIIPLAIIANGTILIVYLKISCLRQRQLRRVASINSCESISSQDGKDSKTAIIVGIIIFSSVFALTPLIVAVILVKTSLVTSNSIMIYSIAYELSFINPMFTPIIFAWRNEKFNKTVKVLLCAGIAKVNKPFRRFEVSENVTPASTTLTHA